ncbi:unnamed protein product [Nippostrongylus brasiliensis]|uniref:CCHC-type domain-containing protein n=1 Tax=Nippostrongylus brasiliensis TaxID=27835 RepID=A0A0N4XSD7_NIPBR|nr:unnamed protein product [Nippostrongylus brasiliensis]
MSNEGESTSRKRELVCHRCKKPGHLRRDCKEPVQVSAQQAQPGTILPRKRQSSPSSKPKTFHATLGTWSCSTFHKANECSGLTGPQTLREVQLLGQKVQALLDTGSQISILPITLLQRAANAGFDLDGDVEEIPQVDRVPIFNASGSQMLFKGAVRLTLAMEGVPKRRVAFFVLKGGDGTLVLGTNVLSSLGFSLQGPEVQHPETKETKHRQVQSADTDSKPKPRRPRKVDDLGIELDNQVKEQIACSGQVTNLFRMQSVVRQHLLSVFR